MFRRRRSGSAEQEPRPRQTRLITAAGVRWIVRHRAWTPWYLLRYVRFVRLRLRHPEVITEGLVFLGRGVEIRGRPGYGRVVLGSWVHVGDRTRLIAHEGTLRIGDKAILGRANMISCYLDVEIGGRTLLADWVYITDFDHRFDDVDIPIKDQGIVKAPVRVGTDCWLGTKVSVLRGTTVGTGCVVAAHAVVRGVIPDRAVAGGVPAEVLKYRERRPENGSATQSND